MTRGLAGVLGILLLFVLAGCSRAPGQLPQPPDVPLVEPPSFRRDIQPIFNEFCVKCHSPNDDHGGLKLDTYENIMKGSNLGAVVVPGSPEKSLLVKVMTHEAGPAMPFHGEKLTLNRIANIQNWVRQGASRD